MQRPCGSAGGSMAALGRPVWLLRGRMGVGTGQEGSSTGEDAWSVGYLSFCRLEMVINLQFVLCVGG